MSQMMHNPAIFDNDPESSGELDSRQGKEWVKIFCFGAAVWFFLKGFMSIVFMEHSLFKFNVVLDTVSIFAGAYIALKWGKDRFSFYLPKSERFDHEFRKAAATIENEDNINKLKKYVSHPNFKDRYPTYGELTALWQLRRREKMEESEKSSIFSD